MRGESFDFESLKEGGEMSFKVSEFWSGRFVGTMFKPLNMVVTLSRKFVGTMFEPLVWS